MENQDSTYVQLAAPCTKNAQKAGLTGQGGSFGRPEYFGKTPPKHAAEPRDCPCRPRAPQRVGIRVRVRVRVGLGSGLGLGWSGSTCKVEIDDTHATSCTKFCAGCSCT